jgi:hypothetical protein
MKDLNIYKIYLLLFHINPSWLMFNLTNKIIIFYLIDLYLFMSIFHINFLSFIVFAVISFLFLSIILNYNVYFYISWFW